MTTIRIMATALAVAFACTGGLVAATPAAAATSAESAADATTAAVPPTALPDCALPGETGGWNVRTFVSDGALSLDPAPVRPRAITLSEPCLTDSGEIQVPYVGSDPKPPILDEDEDGEDDGGPEEGAIFARVCVTAAPSSCVQFLGMGSINGLRPAWCVKFEGSTSTTFYYRNEGRAGTSYSQTTYAGLGSVYANFGSNCSPFPGSNGMVDVGTPPESYFSHNGGCTPSPNTPGAALACGELEGVSISDVGGGYYGGTQGADTMFGHTTDEDDSFVVCATTYTGSGTAVSMTDGDYMAADEIPYLDGLPGFEELTWTRFKESGAWTGVSSTSCAYIVSITLRVCTFFEGEPAGCLYMEWNADRWRTHTAYPGGDDEGLNLVCTLYPDTPGCYEVLNPTVVDGSDFNAVCGSPPAPAWLDFGWLPEFIGYYAHCLFVPANGWDRLGWQATAWDASPLGGIADVLTELQTSLAISETCGPIGGDAGHGFNFTMSTCTWTWAAPMKNVLTLAIVIGIAWWVITFVTRMVIGIPNRKVVDPTDTKAGE